MSASQIVTNPKMETFAALAGLRPLKNRIEDAEQDAAIDADHVRQDQRQAANEEMNRPDHRTK
jgi:hypothetical protein